MGRRTPLELDVPFTLEGLRTVLAWGAQPDQAPATHFDLAHWCARFRERFVGRGDEAPSPLALEIADQVDLAWESRVIEDHPTEALLTLDLSAVRLPTDAFTGWLCRLSDSWSSAIQRDRRFLTSET